MFANACSRRQGPPEGLPTRNGVMSVASTDPSQSSLSSEMEIRPRFSARILPRIRYVKSWGVWITRFRRLGSSMALLRGKGRPQSFGASQSNFWISRVSRFGLALRSSTRPRLVRGGGGCDGYSVVSSRTRRVRLLKSSEQFGQDEGRCEDSLQTYGQYPWEA